MTPTEKALRIEEIPEEVKKFILHVSDVRIERETGNGIKIHLTLSACGYRYQQKARFRIEKRL